MYKFKTTTIWRKHQRLWIPWGNYRWVDGTFFLGRTTGSEENEDELRIEEYYKTLRESFTEFRGGLRDGFKTSLSYTTKWIKKGVGECDDIAAA